MLDGASLSEFEQMEVNFRASSRASSTLRSFLTGILCDLAGPDSCALLALFGSESARLLILPLLSKLSDALFRLIGEIPGMGLLLSLRNLEVADLGKPWSTDIFLLMIDRDLEGKLSGPP